MVYEEEFTQKNIFENFRPEERALWQNIGLGFESAYLEVNDFFRA
jgi:hypothetical protein